MPGTWGGFAADIDRETFYAAFTFLATVNQLSARDIQRIDAYENASRSLIEEIQAKWEELEGATSTVRAAALSDLSARQDARLRALAGEAEELRLFLVGSRKDFDLLGRGLRLGNSLQLLFASSFFSGLSTEQRLLLPEIATEEAAPLRKARREWTNGSPLFFLPATSRIQPPAHLPAALEAKIRAFVREKESLKSDLRNAVLRTSFFISSRTRRLTALAQQQAPRFVALDTLAEEIRVGLTALGFPDRMQPATLPADLTERVGRFYASKVEARRELLSRLRQLRSENPAGKFDIKRRGEGLVIVGSGFDRKAEASLAEFNASQARRYSAFAHESRLLQSEIQQHLATSPERSTRTVDQLAADFARAYAAREKDKNYRDYVRSVLEPGLSPAQRRLLFQAATSGLEQTGGSLLF